MSSQQYDALASVMKRMCLRDQRYDSQRAELRPRNSKQKPKPPSSVAQQSASTATSGTVSTYSLRSNEAMPSSKGEPTDPKLREKVKEEVKAEEKGGGSGSWSAWKAGEMAKRYEAEGGDYKDVGDHKNKSQKGAPEKK